MKTKLKLFLSALSLALAVMLVTSCAPTPPEAGTDTPTETDTKAESVPESTDAATTEEEETPMIKFTVFADFHYKKKMYMSSVDDLKTILKRAKDSGSDFVVHLGDFCNDYIGSPEITNAYLENEYDLPVFGVYGNHELETSGNTMQIVSRRLSNRPVSFGPSREGNTTGHWYYDMKGFRLIGLDTNYSFNPTKQAWEHNKAGSHAPPSGNEQTYSLGPEQREWLDKILADAESKGMKALIFSHAGFSEKWYAGSDANEVRAIFQKYEKTVMMASSGHLHTNRFAVINNIAYFDVNTAKNGYWSQQQNHHYTSLHTYEFQNYSQGEPKGDVQTLALTSLSQGKNTWFFKDPLSAVVTVYADGEIHIDGSKTEWLYGIEPPVSRKEVTPMIGNSKIKLRK